MTNTNLDPRSLVYQWKPGTKKSLKKEKSIPGKSKVPSNVASQRLIITSNFPRKMKNIKGNTKSEQSINNQKKYQKKKREQFESKTKKLKPHSNRIIRNQSIFQKPSETKRTHVSSKKSIEVTLSKDKVIKSGKSISKKAKVESNKKIKPEYTVKYNLEEFEQRNAAEEKKEIFEIYKQRKIQKLLKRLRIPFQDESGMQMISGIFSLGTFVKNIVDSTIKSKNLNLIQKNQFEIQEDFEEDNETLSRASYEELDLKKADLDMSGSSAVGQSKVGGGKSMMLINRPTKIFSPNIIDKTRFFLSPVVKSMIRNNLASRRTISTSKDPLKEEFRNSVPKENYNKQWTDNRRRSLIKELKDESFGNSNEELNYHISPDNSLLEQNEVTKSLNVDFLKKFIEENGHLKFVQSMSKTHRRNWQERKTVVKFKTDKIHILIADDSHKQIESIQNILLQSNVEIHTANDGNEALEKVIKFADSGFFYHLILMDVHMPKCDGYRGTINIRKFEDERKTLLKNHIVAISADEQDVTIGQTKECKMDDFIQKPLSRPILYNVLYERAKELGVGYLLSA